MRGVKLPLKFRPTRRSTYCDRCGGHAMYEFTGKDGNGPMQFLCAKCMEEAVYYEIDYLLRQQRRAAKVRGKRKCPGTR